MGETNAAVCCWHRDRQYFDRNGDCGARNCANADPGDNTDLCWTETEDGTVFPYPGSATEQHLHCHGFAWGNELEGQYDLNGNLKWNNLFFVSMYDHLYTRGYAESITNDPSIAGEQAMCGCVEDMAPIARGLYRSCGIDQHYSQFRWRQWTSSSRFRFGNLQCEIPSLP